MDDDLVAAGQQFFRSQIWSVNVAFLVASLPMSYLAPDGAQILVRSGRMVDDVQRRVFETALLIMELAVPGALEDGTGDEPTGYGYLTLLRLRLLHAASRSLLLQEEGLPRDDRFSARWDPGTQGIPVSQLDVLGTMWCFAIASLDALEAAGRPASCEEREAWVHLWCVAGHYLGLDAGTSATLLPMSYAEARANFEAIRDLQYRGSESGRFLLEQLIDAGHRAVPFRRWDELVEVLVWRSLGDEYATALGMRRPDDRRLRVAQLVWNLTSDPPKPRLEPRRVWRRRVQAFLLREVACRLIDEVNDLRSRSAVDALMEEYGIGRSLAWRLRRRVDRRRRRTFGG
jgi:hypothetical protein